MEIQFWRNDDDKLIRATVNSVLHQLENEEGVGEVSYDDALAYYAGTLNRNFRSDFVINAFKPLEIKLLEFFDNETIIKAINDVDLDS